MVSKFNFSRIFSFKYQFHDQFHYFRMKIFSFPPYFQLMTLIEVQLQRILDEILSKGLQRNSIFFTMDTANVAKIANIRGKTEKMWQMFCLKYLSGIFRNTDFFPEILCPKFTSPKFLVIKMYVIPNLCRSWPNKLVKGVNM